MDVGVRNISSGSSGEGDEEEVGISWSSEWCAGARGGE